MTQSTRVRRGRRTEANVARFLREHGWPFAEPVGAARVGEDITGCPGLSIEVKATADFRPRAWLKQAARRAGLPIAVCRSNGDGEDAALYAAVIPLPVLIGLLHQAGYGDGRTVFTSEEAS